MRVDAFVDGFKSGMTKEASTKTAWANLLAPIAASIGKSMITGAAMQVGTNAVSKLQKPRQAATPMPKPQQQYNAAGPVM